MKKVMSILTLSLVVGSVNAQKIKESEVPAEVKAGMSKHFPNTKVEEWEKEGLNYEAEFDVKKVETSATFDAKGNLLETEVEIAPKALPAGALEYVKKNLGDKKVKEASKITDSKGKVFYEAEVGDVDYIFDDKGVFLEKSQESKDDDQEHDKD